MDRFISSTLSVHFLFSVEAYNQFNGGVLKKNLLLLKTEEIIVLQVYMGIARARRLTLTPE